MLRAFSICASLLALASCGEHKKHDWLIVPGERVGPVTASTSEEALRRELGTKAVKAKDIDIGEGITEPGTVIYEGVPGKTLAVIWKDTSRARPSSIFICYPDAEANCLWRTSDGIGIGTTLKELEARNGGPFKLAGFGWDYSGSVMSWESGKLAACRSGKRCLAPRLSPPPEMQNGLSEQDSMAVMGDQSILSTHPVMQRLNPKIYWLVVEFPN